MTAFPDYWRVAGIGLAIYVRLPDGNEPMYMARPREGEQLGIEDIDAAVRFLGVIADELRRMRNAAEPRT